MATLTHEELSSCTSLSSFLKQVTKGEPMPLAENPPWWVEGDIVEVTKDDFDTYFEMLPPRWFQGGCYAYGEGSGAFTIFWQDGFRYFQRSLSVAETEQFCKLTRSKLHL